MDDGERWAVMCEALKAEELRLKRERYDAIGKALSYHTDPPEGGKGLPLGMVLASLGISEATWRRRLKDYRERYDKPHSNLFFED